MRSRILLAVTLVAATILAAVPANGSGEAVKEKARFEGTTVQELVYRP